jgi:hypothetical protein
VVLSKVKPNLLHLVQFADDFKDPQYRQELPMKT